jgi:hypothetical protein
MSTLDSRPARDLTDRECSKILGALIGGLMTMTTGKTVRDAIRWWADNDKAWEVMERNQGSAIDLAKELIKRRDSCL